MFDEKLIEEYSKLDKITDGVPEKFLNEFEKEFGVSLDSLTYEDTCYFSGLLVVFV